MNAVDAGHLLVTQGRWWINGGHGPSAAELQRGGRCVQVDPVYRSEVYRDAMTRATDTHDERLAAELQLALTVLDGEGVT